MMKDVSRRTMLGALAAGVAGLILERKVFAAGIFDQLVGTAGLVNLSLTALSEDSLRISIAPVDAMPVDNGELGIVDDMGKAPLEAPGPENAHTVAWGRYLITVKTNPLTILVSEKDKVRNEIRFDNDSTAVNVRIGDAPLFGLGEGVHPFDRRGTKDPMINGQHAPDLLVYGSRVPIPWLISGDCWGVFIGQPSGSFDFAGEFASFHPIEATSTRNVYLTLGDTPADVMREYALLTGFPHLPPRWSFGFQQSHRTLADKAEILDEAKAFREKKLPCDAMIYLGTGFCPSGWNTGHGSFTFNEKVFPDPTAIINQFHEEDFKVILHVVPPGDLHGTIEDTGTAAASPGDAVTYWEQHVPLVKAGVDGWWPDEGDRLSTYVRLERNQMYWEGSREVNPDKRPFALHRNGYAGLQRYGWLWSGDTESRWETLKAQIMVGINVGLSGIPYWGSDTGGFVPTQELTPELFVRWFQFSAFCPSFRCHGRTWKLRLPWGWNLGVPDPLEIGGQLAQNWPPPADLHRPDVEVICRKYLNLRYQLLPYTYSAAWQTHTTGIPMMRALWIEFPKDSRATLRDESYMWGDNILVAPVIEKGVTKRTTYLPAGMWWDFWTNEKIEGGKDVTADVDLTTLPLYVRAGAVIPMGPVKQYVDEASEEPFTLKVHPGANGKFHLYDDDGSSFEYENGNYMLLTGEWTDSTRTLTLALDPRGNLGIGRKFDIVLAGESQKHSVELKKAHIQVKL
jgi:alpha-glucosidase (family GH31 glycosyl hydrolase)